MYNTNAQDLFASDYRVYIEGIQVPFETASISNVYGELPSATVVVPPWPGMQELGRNYAPKIHIFWRDYNYGMSQGERVTIADADTARKTARDAYKLIFSGVIKGTSESKEISPGGGGQSLTLTCGHPIEVLKEVLLRFANQAIRAAQDNLDTPSEGSVQSSEWDMNTAMLKAMQGITATTDESDIHHIPEGKLGDLQGTPGILKVLWNILKSDARRNMGSGNDAESLAELYIPLIEDGLKFWERMTGHPSIEKGIADDKYPYQSSTTKRGVKHDIEGDVMVPGTFRTFMGAAAQKELSSATMNSIMAGEGTPETADFMSIMLHTLQKLDYDLVALSAPISKDDGTAREYLVKPVLPYYYAPICNVILPNMISSVSVNNNFAAMPTRTVNLSNMVSLVTGGASGGSPAMQYTAPHSVRYARAGGSGNDLAAALNPYNNKVSKYEWGSGIRSRTNHIPLMYNLLQANLSKKATDGEEDTEVIGSSDAAKAEAAWNKMYPDSKWPGAAKYNPLSSDNGIQAFQRLNFMYADQDFATETARARTAQASGCFNPYAVIGYPMDLIDPVPSKESYHGLCTSVTHTFSAGGSATTSYSVSAVSSFSELAQYNLPPVNPYLTAALDLTDDMRIYANPTAYKKACAVYTEVFGVGAAEPALLQDYDKGTPIPFARDGSYWTTDKYDGLYNTQQGSLMLVARNIMSLIELESDTGNTFVDIADWVDRSAEDVTTIDNPLRVKVDEGQTKILTQGIDAESSPFLTY